MRRLLEGTYYKAVDKEFSFIASFTDQSTEYETTAFIKTVYMLCNEIVPDETEDMGHEAWSGEKLCSLEKR